MKIKVRCQQNVTIDAKGRLALPAPIRRALEGLGQSSLVLTAASGADGATSVWAWTVEDYERSVESRMEELDPFATDVQDFAHSIMASAQDVELDKQGRVRVPPPLREAAALGRECVVFVVLGHVEIWDKEAWEQRSVNARARQQARRGMPRREA